MTTISFKVTVVLCRRASETFGNETAEANLKPVKNEGLTICQLSKIRYSGLSLSTSSD